MKNNRRNLKEIWRLLDEACGALDNATTNIANMDDLPESIREDSQEIDITEITYLKNKIEELIEEKFKKD